MKKTFWVFLLVAGLVGLWTPTLLASPSDKPPAPPGQGECEHGNSGKECRPDPQPEKGKDCEEHGPYEGGVNEDHCLGETTTEETTTETTETTETTTTDETTTQETITTESTTITEETITVPSVDPPLVLVPPVDHEVTVEKDSTGKKIQVRNVKGQVQVKRPSEKTWHVAIQGQG